MPYRNPDLSSEGMPENQQFTSNVASVDISTAAGIIATYTNSTGKRLELQAKLDLSSLQGVATEFDMEVVLSGGNLPLNEWVNSDKAAASTTHTIMVPSVQISIADGETVTIKAKANQTNTAVACATTWTRK